MSRDAAGILYTRSVWNEQRDYLYRLYISEKPSGTVSIHIHYAPCGDDVLGKSSMSV
jgi:hypothetical protein